LAFLGGVAVLTGFPLAAFFGFTVTCCLAGFAESVGFATSAPVVTGASSCSAAFGVASDATLQKENVAAMTQCDSRIVSDFISNSAIEISQRPSAAFQVGCAHAAMFS
jgi:hypothetical protein